MTMTADELPDDLNALKAMVLSRELENARNRPSRVFSGGSGVIDMALLSVIRRWHFREHLSIREICRRTGLSRNTIRKYLRAGGVETRTLFVTVHPSYLLRIPDQIKREEELARFRDDIATIGRLAI